jgi:hypothetical protein
VLLLFARYLSHFFKFNISFIRLVIDLTDRLACSVRAFNSEAECNLLLFISINPKKVLLIIGEYYNLIASGFCLDHMSIVSNLYITTSRH